MIEVELLERIRKSNHEGISELVNKLNLSWLLSDFRENEWKIYDPVSKENERTGLLKFDGNLIGGGRLSDLSSFIHDAKVSLVLAVESAGLRGIPEIGSISSMQHYVNSLKRIMNELVDIGFDGWDNWTQYHSDTLLNRLSYKESCSQEYLRRLKEYVARVEMADLPIKFHKGKKNKSHIDYSEIYDRLGFNNYAARTNDDVRSYIQELNAALSRKFPDYNIGVKKSLIGKRVDNVNVHENQFKAAIGTIKHIQVQSKLCPELFKEPWVGEVVKEDMKIKLDFKKAEGRTKNIPVPIFLKTMDAAVRFILDYSEPLFYIESTLEKKYDEAEKKRGAYQAGKDINEYATELGEVISGKYSPFPLAAYKHYQQKKKVIEDKWWDDFSKLLDQKKSSKEIQSILKISKAQFDSRKRCLGKGKKQHTGLSLQKALYQFLPLSCLLVIFAFSARREVEVFGLKAGCYRMTPEGWEMQFYVAKTNRKKEWFVTVPLVIKAIKILERLSAKGRKRAKSNSLFEFDDSFKRAPIKLDRLERCIDDFLDFIGVERDEHGKHFKFSEHQFRRFFAILYFYRYENGADYEALMHELRHTDWSMTERYLTELSYGQILKEVEQEFIADLALKSSAGDGGISGEMTEELRGKLNRSVNIVPENRKALALKVIKDESYCLDFISEGVCFGNTPGKADKSNCYSSGHVMLHRASAELCKGCPNLLSIEEIKTDNRIVAIDVDECSPSPILQAASLNEEEGDVENSPA